MVKNLPLVCPSCSGQLRVTTLQCPGCETSVSGDYALPVLLRMSAEERDFALRFIRASGSLKEMAKQMGVSYPTVRNRLNDLIDNLPEVMDAAPDDC